MQNILLITIDSLRADHLGCYGYDRPTSPTMDQLASDGSLFQNAFSHGGTTRKSFPAILTSSYPLMYGGFERISEKRTLISELLSDAGYQTAGLHSNLYLSADFGYSRGFDHFYDSKTEPSLTARARQFVKQRLNQDGVLFNFLKTTFEQTEKHAGVEVGSAYIGAEEMTDRAIDVVDSFETGTPTFLWVHYMDVHHPYLPPSDAQRHFREEPIPERRAIKLRRKMLESPDEVTDTEFDDLVDLYDAEIRYTDDEIGRLLSHIEESWGDDSTVILTADHGEEFRDHGNFSHNTHHDEGVHVPLLLDDGSMSDRFEEIVGLVDLGPTIADYADTASPDSFYGYNLRSLLNGADWPRDSVIGEWGEPGPGSRNFFYRSRDWKYMRFASGREELFDIRNDPDEQHDVIDDEPEALAGIRDAVDEHATLLDSTYEDLGDVAMDDEVRERLQMLGYKE